MLCDIAEKRFAAWLSAVAGREHLWMRDNLEVSLTATLGTSSMQINDLFSGDHPDSSVRSVVTHIKGRLEESETLQQQAQNNSLAQFSASPDLQNEFVGAVIGAMESHTDLSTQILNNPERFVRAGPSDSLDPLQPLDAAAVGGHPRHCSGRRRRAGAHRWRAPISGAVESPRGAIARCTGTLRREGRLEARVVHPCGPDRSLHGECAKRVQLGGARRTERMPGSCPVCAGETSA